MCQNYLILSHIYTYEWATLENIVTTGEKLIKMSFIFNMSIICSLRYFPYSVSGIISLYLYPPDTEYVGPDQAARTAQADLSQYIMQSP